ncbi:MAG: tetratricopeptide repeat protein [Ardenticatenaceae bacterium]|nr:tetratricopeptide repeat protein [Ardenticatenaceae bacterium]
METAVSASEQLQEPIIAAGFLVDLATILYWRGQLTRAEQLYISALEAIRSVPSEQTIDLAISRICHHLGIISRTRAQFSQANFYLEKALALAQRWEDTGGIANNLLELGNLANDQGNVSEALAYYNQSLAMNLSIPHPINVAINKRNIGNVLYETDYPDQAEKHWQEALKVFTEHNDKRNVAGILHTLAQLALDRNDLITARHLCTQSIDMKQQIGFQSTLPVTISLLAMITYAEGDLGIAESLFQQAISMSETMGDLKQTNRQRFNLAILYELTEQFAQAEQLLNQVVALDQLHNLPDAAANQAALHRVHQKQSL